MIELSDAQARMIALTSPVSSESVSLDQAVGRWLAEDVTALRTQPARDLSAMDGYAIDASGVSRAWRVIGESAAGRGFQGAVAPGEAVRIFTGAALPEGTNAVIIQENVERDGETVKMLSKDLPPTGAHVRPSGSDFSRGELLVAAGTRLSAAHVALVIMAGHTSITARRPIRIALISTGDELVPAGMPVAADQIPATNALMIAAMLHDWPVEIIDHGIVRDELDATMAAIRQARDSDIIVTIGGASVGDHDLVRPALIAAGASIDFWKVAMRPGKPVMMGTLGDALVIGLPGNPVSAFVTALLFLKPAIAALSGAEHVLPRRVSAILGAPLPAVGPRTDHLRAKFIGDRVAPLGPDDSAALKSLARADALIVRAAGAKAANRGEIVEIIILS